MRLILLIYTTPARLLNALALRGYFSEATFKKASQKPKKRLTIRNGGGVFSQEIFLHPSAGLRVLLPTK
jgi:hypothetical protein